MVLLNENLISSHYDQFILISHCVWHRHRNLSIERKKKKRKKFNDCISRDTENVLIIFLSAHHPRPVVLEAAALLLQQKSSKQCTQRAHLCVVCVWRLLSHGFDVSIINRARFNPTPTLANARFGRSGLTLINNIRMRMDQRVQCDRVALIKKKLNLDQPRDVGNASALRPLSVSPYTTSW